MNRDSRSQWARWRNAEREHALDDADRAFAGLARHWPRAVVPPGLAARVTRLALAEAAEPAWGWSWIGLRVSVAAALTVSGLMLGGLSGQALAGLLLASLQAVAAAVGTTLAMMGGWADVVTALGVPLLRVARAVTSVLDEPLPMFVLLVNVLIASAALTALRRLMAVREV